MKNPFKKDATQATTSTCPHCKESVNPAATRCPHCQAKIQRGIGAGGLLVVLLVIWIFGTVISSSMSNMERNSQAAIPPTPEELARQRKELAIWRESDAGKLCSQHSTWTREDCDSLIQRKVWTGMSYDMVVYLYKGKPDHANASDYGSGVRYQYCWDDYDSPSCFYDNNNDGIIDSYN